MTTHEVKTLTDEIADDPELRREVECEWFSDGTIIQIEQKMEALGLSRKELASRLKCSPANVTQLLRRGSNLTLETLMDIALAMHHRFLPPSLVPLSSTPGAVVGVMEWSNISAHFARVDKALEESAKRERRMESHLAQIDAILRQR